MIAIIDYGMGNLRSVQKGFEKVGFSAKIVTDSNEIVKASGVVLPGVGAFKDAMENLQASGMVEAIHEVVKKGTPFLGICLGLQLMFSESEEWGLHKGLDLVEGRVRKIPAGVKIPHMGWNAAEIVNDSPIMAGIDSGSYFYFVHSYYVDPVDPKVTTCQTDYNMKFTSIITKDNLFGIQFHPEKSSSIGLKILKNFGELI